MKPVEDKNFLSFLGRNLIERQLDLISDCGFKDVILIGGKHNLNELKKIAKSFKIKITVLEQKNLDMGMCGAILTAKKIIKNEDVLVFSSNDIVEKKAFSAVMEATRKEKGEKSCGFFLAKKIKEYFPGGYLKINKNGFIEDIVEKPVPGKEPSNLINLVVHYHKNPKELIENLEKISNEKDDGYEKALGKMIKNGAKMRAVSYAGEWLPIKYPWHVQNAFKYFFKLEKKKIDKSAKIAKNAIINGEVIICKNVKIFDGAVINGPAYIGDNSIVATNALVRESHVGGNCVIGFSTEVARSFLGHDVWTHSNYIGDSVIGNNVSFGAGAVTGNLRLDEENVLVDYDGKKIDTKNNKFGLITGDHVRVGVNTSFMPGVKIGGGSFVGAGIIVNQNVPEKSFVRGEVKLKITPNKIDVKKMNRHEQAKIINNNC